MHVFDFRSSLLVVAISLAAGCDSLGPAGPTKRHIAWDLSKGRAIAQLSGGKWSPNRPGLEDHYYDYYVKGDRQLSLSVLLPSDRNFELGSVRDVLATQREGRIQSIKIASYGYSQQGAIERVEQLHKEWHGAGIGDVSKWVGETAKLSLDSYNTSIHEPDGPNDPVITATIEYNYGNADNRWYIMVEFFWPDE